MITFIIGVHDKIDELLCQLEILSFFDQPHQIIVVYSGPEPPPASGIRHVRINPPNRNSGPMLAWLEGLRHAQGEFSVYRNADDWIFSREHTARQHALMQDGGKDLAGYNWFGAGHWANLTLNELYVRNEVLAGVNLDEWAIYFSTTANLCEMAVADKLCAIVPEPRRMKVSGRERDDSVGCSLVDPDNNRWICRPWLMLSHHDMNEKRQAYASIRDHISYAADLERLPNFARWLASN